MIRFLPDTWRDTFLRPIAMAAPDAGVYIEIMAPDFRFAIAMALLVALAIFRVARQSTSQTSTKPAMLLTGVMGIAFVPWLATTANGRYFIPFLLAIGPLCIALIYLLPTTRAFRFTLALCVVGLQGFAVQQASSWPSWGLARWKDAPYFQVEWPADMASTSAAYLTLSTISYSLVAPQLPATSQWMSLANAPAATSNTPDAKRAQALLAGAQRLRLLAPAIPNFSDVTGLPTEEIRTVINTLLVDHRLALMNPSDCRLVRSPGLATMAFRREALADPAKTRNFGFWVCSLQRAEADSANVKNEAHRFDAVFRAIEAQCPRFFPAGAETRLVTGGEMRTYYSSEMKVYVLEEGLVLYKYYRAFNPVRIGSRDDVLSGKAKVDCDKIRGRSGLPWEREI